MKLRPRTDANQPAIVKHLRQIPGVSVEILAAVGGGVPDLLVGYRGENYLLEVKDPAKIPSKRRLTDDQEVWHANWRGQAAVVMTFEDCVRVIGYPVK